MKRHLTIIGAIIATLLLLSCSTHKGTFTLINKADESIVRASVAVCGQNIELKHIQPGDTALGSYRVTSDSHYRIEIDFGSGKKLSKETGYVTNGMDFQHEITVTSSSIEITNTKMH